MGLVASWCFKLRDLLGVSNRNQLHNKNKNSPSTFTTFKESHDSNWVLDTGVTYYILNVSSNLGNHVPYNGHNGIFVGNDITIFIFFVSSTTLLSLEIPKYYKMFYILIELLMIL